jgi:hypothetical protein
MAAGTSMSILLIAGIALAAIVVLGIVVGVIVAAASARGRDDREQ